MNYLPDPPPSRPVTTQWFDDAMRELGATVTADEHVRGGLQVAVPFDGGFPAFDWGAISKWGRASFLGEKPPPHFAEEKRAIKARAGTYRITVGLFPPMSRTP